METAMNCYDFDTTIYRGDSTTDFFFYLILTRPYLLVFLPWFLFVGLLYCLHLVSKKKFKEAIFFFIPYFSSVEKVVDKFWQHNANKIEEWYAQCRKDDDIVVSASLDFILRPMLQLLNVKKFVATKYNTETGKIIGKNCYGKQKVIAYREEFKNRKPEAYVSDSLSDLPMMKYCGKGYLVKNGRLKEVSLEDK